MFITNTTKETYIPAADVKNLPISYEGKKHVTLFGKDILVEDNPWLWHLHLKLTNACNAHCSFCVEQNSKCSEDADYYVKQVDRMLTEMEREGILYSVSLTGGEPLLFNRLDDLFKVLGNHGIRFLTMNTNGKYLFQYQERIDVLFDFVDVSRHAVDDIENRAIFRCDEIPSRNELQKIKCRFFDTKMRIQCVMQNVRTIDDMNRFIDAFSFANDLSFRRLMSLSEEHGVTYDVDKDLYDSILKYAFDNWELVEQTIQDYYVYEIYNNGRTNITFSYSDMDMLSKLEPQEDDRVCREFVIHPNGVISGSWNPNRKVISR